MKQYQLSITCEVVGRYYGGAITAPDDRAALAFAEGEAMDLPTPSKQSIAVHERLGVSGAGRRLVGRVEDPRPAWQRFALLWAWIGTEASQKARR